MKIRGTATASTVHKDTRAKHVVAEADQATAAEGNYGDSTFVTSATVLTAAVDAHDHDFPDPQAGRSVRKDVDVTVPIHLYEKTTKTKDGLKKGEPVGLTVDGVDTLCEVGAVKTGADAISIEHFKKK